MKFSKNVTVANINAETRTQAIQTVNEELGFLGESARIAFFCETYFGEFIGMTENGEKVGTVEAWVEDGHKDHPYSGFAIQTYQDDLMMVGPVTLMVQL